MALGNPGSEHQTEKHEFANGLCKSSGLNCRMWGRMAVGSGFAAMLPNIRHNSCPVSPGCPELSRGEHIQIERHGLHRYIIGPIRGHRQRADTARPANADHQRARCRYMRHRGGAGERMSAHLLYAGGIRQA